MDADIKKILEHCEQEEAMRAATMPTEKEALRVMFAGYQRLKELGFREAIYCPKDGSTFDAIEPGSTGIGKCLYMGKWPTGSWWMLDAGDLWPSRPCLYRPIVANEIRKLKTEKGDGSN